MLNISHWGIRSEIWLDTLLIFHVAPHAGEHSPLWTWPHYHLVKKKQIYFWYSPNIAIMWPKHGPNLVPANQHFLVNELWPSKTTSLKHCTNVVFSNKQYTIPASLHDFLVKHLIDISKWNIIVKITKTLSQQVPKMCLLIFFWTLLPQFSKLINNSNLPDSLFKSD